MTRVLVLGGGPDAERKVSLVSAAAVAEALRLVGEFEVVERTIDRVRRDDLRAMPGDVVFPVLHGAFGEGGPLQELLEADGRPFVGSGSAASRLAMDKAATKAAAVRLGVPTPAFTIFDPRDEGCALPLPVVLKPVHDGSSVGLHLCRDRAEWHAAHAAALADARGNPGRVYMVEQMIHGRELTVGLLDGAPLPIVEIVPADGVYDYEAKYHRDDTRYVVSPALPPGAGEAVQRAAAAVAGALGVRHMARADFILDAAGIPWLLEVNTIPGFTGHSLLPMAARSAGLEMPALCARLVALALRDARSGAALPRTPGRGLE